MKKFVVGLHEPFLKNVLTETYSIKATTEKDKETIRDLTNRGVLRAVYDQKLDYMSFDPEKDSMKIIHKIQTHYRCDKIYMGEVEYYNIINTDYQRHILGIKDMKYLGYDIEVVPWMSGLLPVRIKK